MVSQCNFASPVKRFRDSKCVVVLNKIKGLLRCVTILATIGNRYWGLNFMKFLHFLGSTGSTNIFRAPVRVSPYFDSSHFSAAAHLLIISELFHYCNNRRIVHRCIGFELIKLQKIVQRKM